MPELNSETEKLLADIASISSAKKLWQLLAHTFEEHGIHMASYHLYNLGSGDVQTAAYGHPEPFESEYIKQGWAKVDPIHQRALKLGVPFRWRDIRSLAELTDDHEKFLTVAKQAGLTDGLAFGVYGPNMRNGFVGLGFGPSTPEPGQQLVWAFQLLCQAGHLRYCELIEQDEDVRLSPRELETLKWIASGKSNSVIAQIMNVSTHTVDSNIRRIYSKLDVSDRTTAAIKGLGTGLLQSSSLVT